MEEHIENPNFKLKGVAELLDEKHIFYIPSYQRGYRWGKKQIEDLLKDIWDFAKNDEKKKTDFYCLQPIVVKKKEVSNGTQWIVIDGQQRLTTLYLILSSLKKDSRTSFVENAKLYDIMYATRSKLNLDKPDLETDIDSFHVTQARTIIARWFENNDVRYSQIEDVLFLNKKSKEPDDEIPQVKVIWYVAENGDDIKSIKVFNNLNKGKIKLTNAELIKALFILKSQELKNGRKVEELNVNEFAYEWNEIENSLHDNRFWYFLANKDYNPATRIDIIFDFLTGKSEKNDADYSYRKFQNLYDKSVDQLWVDKKIGNFTEAWKRAKEVYNTFLYWYEDGILYHYIGFLIYNKISLNFIFEKCGNLSKSKVELKLKTIISDKIITCKKEDVNFLSYSEDYTECKNLLLFFNIETCVKQHRNQNSGIMNNDSITYYKFPFDLYKLNVWDIEHVGSQKDNPLKEIKDKIVWLKFISDINLNNNDWNDIKKSALDLLKILEEKKRDEGEKFKAIYANIHAIAQQNDNDDKDTLDNLTLLDAGTNRGYGNALFPTKRQIIIENDTKGNFIPPCTRNLFLKYYSKVDTNTSQWKNTWNDFDRKEYLQAIHETIDFILK